MKSIQNTSRNRLVQTIDEFLQSKELSSLSESEIEYICKTLLIDKLKNEITNEIKKFKIHIPSLKENWLSIYASKNTQNIYSSNLDVFLNWLKERDSKAHIVTLKANDIDDYIVWLKKQSLSDNTIHIRMATVSSFFSYLQRIDVLDKNYFKGCRGRPKKKIDIKTHDEIPNSQDIEIIESTLKNDVMLSFGKGYKGKVEAARIGLAIVTVIKYNGLRAGSLKDLHIDRSGYYKTFSKGKEISGKLHSSVIEIVIELNLNRHTPFKNINTNSKKMWFIRFCQRLVRDGTLKTAFSLHDLRHFAAIEHWKENKDIYQLRKFLHHESIATTQIYLSSLNMEI